MVLLALFAAGIAVWFRPLACFRLFNEAQMYLNGASSRFTMVEGYRVHYYVLGPANGPPVVLVHGLGGRAEDWAKLAPPIAKAGYRVYLPDLPGYGQSEWPPDFSYSIPDEAKVVLAFFDVVGLHRADLGGWSMGGWIVQLVAAEHPDRVNSLMLFDAAGLHVQPAWDTQLFTPVTPAQLDKLDTLLTPHPPRVPGFVARDILHFSRKHAWVIRRALNLMLQVKDTTDDLLPTMKMPVLLIWGENDRIIPLDQGETMHRLIPHSRLAVIPNCGHLAPNECAGQIAPTVVNFLRQ
jgi:pimeloyl-ACP methyl ester carboxylesterase